MEKEIIIALIGLVGISLGAFLSGLGYFIKVRSERQKNKKTVLFYLLEIRQLIKSEYANSEEFSNNYFKACENYLQNKGIADNTSISISLKELIKDHFAKIINATKPSIGINFISSFEKSVELLSQDNPVLAYKLKGRQDLKNILLVQNDYIEKFNTLEEFHSEPEIIRSATSNHMIKLNHSVVEDLIKDIDTDINLLAWNCGFLTWWKCRPILKETSKPEVEFESDEITKFFDEFLSVLANAANKYEETNTSPQAV